jgi:hypothetical protein
MQNILHLDSMEKITIELLTEEIGGVWRGWKVSQGEKYADGLGFDEMLGLVSALTLPEERPTLQWMKTKEQHEARRSSWEKSS